MDVVNYEDLLERILARVPDDKDKREGSIIYDAVAPCAYFLTQQAWMLNNFIDLVLPDTAVGEYLERTVKAFGLERKKATCAVRVIETSGETEIGSRWGKNGVVYVVEELLSENRYSAVCETAGEVGNIYSGDLEPMDYTSVTAQLKEILEAGEEEEGDEELRRRFYEKVRLPATSGNVHHYKLWALEVEGVGDAKVYPLDDGPGTVTVMVVDYEKKIDATLEDKVLEHINALRPIGATVTVTSPGATQINVSAKVLLDGTKTMEEVKDDFSESLDGFLRELVFSGYRVSYAKIGNLLLDTEGVEDYEGLLINGQSGNVLINDRNIPVPGTIGFQEVSRIATI